MSHTPPSMQHVVLPQRLVDAINRLPFQPSRTTQESIYVYDIETHRTLSISGSVASLLGYTAADIHNLGIDGLATRIHPQDLHLVSEHYQRLPYLRAGEVITLSYRMCQADGHWCWLRSQETPLQQIEHGYPQQVLGLVQIIGPVVSPMPPP